MGIVTYDEIVNAATAYSDRYDIDVKSNMQIFIIMAEARINRVLKVREQTHRIYTPTVEGKEYYTLPHEFNGMRSIQFNHGGVDDGSLPVPLNYVTPEVITRMQHSEYDEQLQYYTIINNQIQLHKTLPGKGTLEMVFYRKVPPLNKDNAINWMSADHPDIYLAGVIAEIETFVKNYEVAQGWDAKMSRSIDELADNDISARWTGAPLAMRLMR